MSQLSLDRIPDCDAGDGSHDLSDALKLNHTANCTPLLSGSVEVEAWVSSEDDYMSKVPGVSENFKSSNILSGTGSNLHIALSVNDDNLCISNGNSEKCVLNQQTQSAVTDQQSDGGWGWVIVIAVFFNTSLIGGVAVSFSLLYLEFVVLFDASRAVAGWIGSLHIFTTNILGIFIGTAVSRFGSRRVGITGSLVGFVGFCLGSFATSIVQMYIAVGLIAGSGAGMLLISSIVLLQQSFNRRRALAVSLGASGFSFGGLTFGPLTGMLLQQYNLSGTLLIIAAIFLQASVFCCLFRPAAGFSHTGEKKSAADVRVGERMELAVATDAESDACIQLPETGEKTVEPPFTDTKRGEQSTARTLRLLLLKDRLCRLFANVFDFSLLRRGPFRLYVVAAFFLFMGTTSFMQHTPSRAAHYGVEPWLVSLLPTLTCSATGVSRIVLGFVANMSCSDLVLQFGISAMLSGMVQMTTWLTTTFETMAVYCIMQGTLNGCLLPYFLHIISALTDASVKYYKSLVWTYTQGGCQCILSTILVELNGIENIARSLSIWTLAVGLGCLLGTPFSGFIFDVSANYDIPFVVGGSIQALGGLIAVYIYVVKCCRKGRRQDVAIKD